MRETNGDVQLLITARVAQAPAHAALGMDCADPACHAQISITLPTADRWVRYGIPLKCFATHGADMTRLNEAMRLTVEGASDITIGEVRLGNDVEQELTCP
jgi:beta-glucosidase